MNRLMCVCGALVLGIGCGQVEDPSSRREALNEILRSGVLEHADQTKLSAVMPATFDNGVCEDGEEIQFLRTFMNFAYLYPEQLRDVPLMDFTDPDEYVGAAVRDVDLAPDNDSITADDVFSFYGTAGSFDDEASGVPLGFFLKDYGFLYDFEMEEGELSLRVRDVAGGNLSREPKTSAGNAGLRRGNRIVAINGKSIGSIVAGRVEDLDRRLAIGQELLNVSSDARSRLSVVRRDGSRFDANLKFDEPITTFSVPELKVFERGDGKRVGYIVLREFELSLAPEVRDVFAELAELNITDLILDVRYNGGGFEVMADFVGDLIYGIEGEGKVFRRNIYNPVYAQNLPETADPMKRFAPPVICPGIPLELTPEVLELIPADILEQFTIEELQALLSNPCAEAPPVGLTGIDSVTFITTDSSASATEQLINGLRPHLPVRLVGSRTAGKPYAQLRFPVLDCFDGETTGNIVVSKTSNTNGVTDYVDGFPVNCSAEDDTTRRFGDPKEASLAKALDLIDGRGCLGN